jgi:hypothetical protein
MHARGSTSKVAVCQTHHSLHVVTRLPCAPSCYAWLPQLERRTKTIGGGETKRCTSEYQVRSRAEATL